MNVPHRTTTWATATLILGVSIGCGDGYDHGYGYADGDGGAAQTQPLEDEAGVDPAVVQSALLASPLPLLWSSSSTGHLTTADDFGLECGVLGWCGDLVSTPFGSARRAALTAENIDGTAKIVFGPVEIPRDGDYFISSNSVVIARVTTRVRADSTPVFNEDESASAIGRVRFITKIGDRVISDPSYPVLRDRTGNEDRSKTMERRVAVPTGISVVGARKGELVSMEVRLELETARNGRGTLARASSSLFGLEANSANPQIASIR